MGWLGRTGPRGKWITRGPGAVSEESTRERPRRISTPMPLACQARRRREGMSMQSSSGRPAVPVFFGAWLGLAVVSGLAILLGRWLLKRVKLSLVRYVAAVVCAVLAVLTLIEAFTE